MAISFLFFVVFLAFLFDFINGFHDAANSIATIVTTGVLTPKLAVLWAAFFNFIAFLFFKLSVANIIGTGLIEIRFVDTYFIFATLTGAIIWNLTTWYFGLPSSSSHSLIGGLIGAAIIKGGLSAVVFSGLTKVVIAIILSPILGLLIALGLMKLFKIILQMRRNKPSILKKPMEEKLFARIQLISSALLSLSHGGNDAQKTMGIIAMLLYSTTFTQQSFNIPLWVVIGCNFVMALGTLSGGWRIVHTMGKKITQLNYMSGSCAEFGAATTIIIATQLGIPVSTTHTVTGAITGVAMSKNISAVNWSIIQRIVWAWILTMPAAAIIAGFLIMLQQIKIVN